MNLVTLENVSHHYSERVLLDSVNLLINTGDRIGLIGRNGSGKTTLLRLIAGIETPVAGQITVWGGVRTQYLPQEPKLNDNLTVLAFVFQSEAPQIQLLRHYEQVNGRLQREPTNPELQEQFAQLSHEMDQTGSWSAEAEAKTILTELGITDFDARMGTLSGGQRKRVALAHALIDPADLLILDEPTNHIDADTIAWLEQYLLTVPKALLMVTHDRYFLERVVNKIVEIDRRELMLYPGNYGRYLERSAKRHQQLKTAEKKRQALLRQELEWLHRAPMARGTKQKARQQRVAEMQALNIDQGDQRVAMILASRRLGKRVLEVNHLSKAYGSQVLFRDLNFQLDPGDRIGIIGPNGAGKSTFLNILAGKTKPDSGQVTWGQTVHLGYYDQESQALRDDMRVIDYIAAEAPLIRTQDGERVEAAQMLTWFLFTRPEQQARISSLSGGERRRLYLLRTLIHQPNVLFLDEPTNDLDVQTLTVLEQFLDHFKGCLVVVSHDRYFLDRNVDFLLSFEDGVLGTRYPAPYETYRRLRQEAVDPPPPPLKERLKPRPPSPRPRKLSWKERQELETVESKIDMLATKISELEAAINQAGNDYQRLTDLASELEKAKISLEIAETRWLELSEVTDSA